MRAPRAGGEASELGDELISGDEIVALLLNVSDIAASLEAIEALLGGDGEGEEEADGS